MNHELLLHKSESENKSTKGENYKIDSLVYELQKSYFFFRFYNLHATTQICIIETS